MSKISIIVPVYNVDSFLNRCVDSLVAQTFSDFKLLLVDDGSTDWCPQICEEYAKKDSRISVIHQCNSGVSVARNTGIEWALANNDSEWIGFVDSDDWVHPQYLERLLGCAESQKVNLISCNYLRTENFEEDVITYKGKPFPELWDGSKCIIKNDVIGTAPWRRLFRAELLKELRFPEGRYYEDEYFTYKALYKAHKTAWLDEKLYFYYMREGSAMHSDFSIKRFVDLVDALIEREQFFKINGEEELYNITCDLCALTNAKCVIRAIHAGLKEEIPDKYYMSEREAYKIIYKMSPNDNFCWFLSLLHPKWEKPHMYIRKIKKLIGIKCN